MTDPSSDELPHRTPWQPSGKLVRLEVVVVLLAAPFLVFPTLSPLLTLFALIGIAVVWLLPLFTSSRPGLPSTPFNIALIPWGLVLIVGILVSADPDQTLPKATGLILSLAIWRLLVLLGRNRSAINLAMLGFVAIGTLFTVTGAIGLDTTQKIPLLTQYNPAQLFSLPEQYGLAIHPNQLAGLICLLLPVLISLLFGLQFPPGKGVWRIALLIVAALVFAILILTQSRGGWVGVAGGLVILLIAWSLLMPPSLPRTVVRITMAAVLVIGILGLVWIGPDRLQQLWLDPPADTAVGTFTTLNYRKELWPWALTAAGDFAFTGTGLGAFREVAFRLYPVQISPNADIGHAHNIFLQTALDVGLPGLVVYVALLLIAFGGAWWIARNSPSYRPYALGLFAGLAALHIYGLADALSLGAKPGILFWYALGLIAAMSLTTARREHN
ncbi:MAG: O-antigen ligase family protein [Chloroflexota bacterium]